ncbi:MAG TPA: CBS domain-containing protein [Propylenella sp.]
MRARDVMTADVTTVAPGASIAEAARLMLDRRISGLPVVDRSSGQLVGLLTEGDLMRRAELVTERRPWWFALTSSPEERAQAFVKAHGLKVEDVMTKEVVTIDEHEPLERIAMLFEERGIKRAPVVRDGRLIGIVSRANLLQGVAAAKIGGTGPDDSEIRSTILATAQADAGVRTPVVDVTVAGGVVHLWGNVASEAERDAIRVVAETAEGVREVHNHIRVLPPSVLEWKPE